MIFPRYIDLKLIYRRYIGHRRYCVEHLDIGYNGDISMNISDIFIPGYETYHPPYTGVLDSVLSGPSITRVVLYFIFGKHMWPVDCVRGEEEERTRTTHFRVLVL